MGKRITLMLTALLAIATVLFVVIYLGGLKPVSDADPLPDYTVMTKAELSALVLMNPNWSEPRARLSHILLQEENASSALEHMLVLAWSDWEMTELESEFVGLIRDNPVLADACLTLLAEQRSSWIWPKELSVKIATDTSKPSYILANLPALLKTNPQHPLAIEALAAFITADPVTAWEIGTLLGEDYLGQVLFSVFNLSAEEQAEIIPALAEKHPGPLTAVLEASMLGGNDGLEALLALEDDGLQPWESTQYTEIKLNLLLQALPEISEEHMRNLDFASTISRANPNRHLLEPEQSMVLDLFLAMEGQGHEPPDYNEYSYVKYVLLQAVVPREAHLRTVTEEYFNNIQSEHLFYIIEDWTEKLHWAGYDEHSLMLNIKSAAEILAEDPEWAHIESVMSPPGPPSAQAVLPIENRRDQGQINRISLSPDGNQLIYFTANTIWWYDLLDQQYRLAQTAVQTDGINVHWTPDSRNYVLEFRNPESGNLLQLFTTTQSGISVETDIGSATVLGWQNNSTLLLSSESSTGYRVSSLDPITGRRQISATMPQQPIITPTGKIAWVEISDSILTVSIQSSQTSYNLPQEDLTIAGWLPGDRGVLLRSNTDAYLIVDFATGVTAELDVKGSFSPYALGWAPENKIPVTFALGLVNHIMILDLEDMSMEHTGIVSYFGSFSGNGHYWHVYAGDIYIYKIQ